MKKSLVDLVLIGCSEYSKPYNNLPFVENDILELTNSLKTNLPITIDNITTYSKYISYEIINEVKRLIGCNQNDNKTLIFYFSGHGENKHNKSYVIFSDNRKICIKDLLELITNNSYKSKWIIIDACYSGQFILNEDNSLVGSGTIVTCSSSKEQKSFPNKENTQSYFTQKLCDVLSVSKRENKVVPVEEIVNLTRNLMIRDDSKQDLINRQNFVGTIYFGEKEKVAKLKDKAKLDVSYEYKDFSIVKIEPIHTNSLKRYCIHIYSNINDEKKLEVILNTLVIRFNSEEYYNNEKFKIILKNRPIDFLNVYVYPDNYNFDINNPKYILNYNNGKISINIQNQFESILKFRIENTISDEELIGKIEECYYNSLTNLKDLYKILEEIKNNVWDEQKTYQYQLYLDSKKSLNKIYMKFTDIPFGSPKTDCEYNKYLEYFNYIKDLLLFMSEQGIDKWNNKETRYFLIDNTISKINNILNEI